MNYRLFIFLLAIVFGIFFSLPTILQSETGKKITLGLDLQGGLYMLLGVKSEEAVVAKLKSTALGIKFFADKEGVLIDNLKTSDGFINFELLDSDEKQKLSDYLSKLKGLEVKEENLKYSIKLTSEEELSTKNFAINQAVETIRNRLDQFGLSEPNVAKSGEDKILVELPGIKNQADEQRARELIAKTAHLELMAVDEDRANRVSSISELEAKEYGDVILSDAKDHTKHLLKEIPILDGSMLTDARVAFDQNNQPVVSFTLNSMGANVFGEFTGKNIGKRIAIVMDKKVYSAPVVRERIGGGSGQISGSFTVQEAGDLAIALRSGALPAPVMLLEKRSVGPSLGADSIKSSMIALISGFVVVVAFMMFYYRMAGVIANIALIVNVFIIIAIMSLFGAVLTLPGMAGIVLTVGMAVDANVIIIERVREALREGANFAKAIKDGYDNAMSSILDSNITTLIATTLLYAFGTGPIKGFAITMSIGIATSMLTAILGTHGIYNYILPKYQRAKNSMLWFGIRVR